MIWRDRSNEASENSRCQEYFQHAMRFPLMNNNSVGKCFNGFGGSIDRENDAQKQQQLKRSTWIPIRSQIIDVPPECSPVWCEKTFNLCHSDSTFWITLGAFCRSVPNYKMTVFLWWRMYDFLSDQTHLTKKMLFKCRAKPRERK